MSFSAVHGMIFTFMRAFDLQANWDYVEHVKSIFELYGTEFYYVELIAPQSVRLACSTAENRLRSNPSSAIWTGRTAAFLRTTRNTVS